VATVLAACHAAGAAVVPQGGNTGLVGGGVPRDNEVVLSLRRLDTVSAPGPDATLVAGAGATVAAVHEHARRAGWVYGVDLAARDGATIGGTIATNAGGEHTVHYGPTRAQVVGVEAVLADGTVVRDLGPLLVGSEGTLAVITRARLRLVAPARDLESALVGCPDLAAAVDLTTSLRRALPDLHAVEYMETAGLALVGEPIPLHREHGAYLLVEATGGLERVRGMEEAAVAADADQRQALWHLREHHADAIARQPGPPAHKLDVALPLTTIAAFRAALDALGTRLIVFGHLAVGNLHVNVLEGSDDLDDAILRLVAEHGGSIAAEHGVGTAKARYLPLTSTAADLDARKALKRALDPAGVLNPGVILPAR
jgi:FAD/FMN-containing dehydrogenase